MIVALRFPLRCVKTSQWPPYLPPWHHLSIPLAPQRLPQHSHELQSPALNCNLGDIIGNSIKITAAESLTQIIGLNVGQIEEGCRGMVRGCWGVKIRGGSRGDVHAEPWVMATNWPLMDQTHTPLWFVRGEGSLHNSVSLLWIQESRSTVIYFLHPSVTSSIH